MIKKIAVIIALIGVFCFGKTSSADELGRAMKIVGSRGFREQLEKYKGPITDRNRVSLPWIKAAVEAAANYSTFSQFEKYLPRVLCTYATAIIKVGSTARDPDHGICAGEVEIAITKLKKAHGPFLSGFLPDPK